MGKKAVIISDLKQVYDIDKYVDAYLVPLDFFSINYTNTFSLDDVKWLKKFNKEIFVFINKNIHESELERLENLLKEIDKLQIDGIIFYDISIVKLKKELSLKTDLVWHQEHLTTNYGAVNFWFNNGVKYSYLSSELTKREIDEIRSNTDALIFVNVFGYIPMFTSRRHLVDNYLDSFNIKDKGNRIFKEGKFYNITDSDNGTVVYSNYILNADVSADYLVYNSNFIDDFKRVFEDNDFEKESGFLFKETIYKVK